MGYQELAVTPTRHRAWFGRTRAMTACLGLMAISWLTLGTSFTSHRTGDDFAKVQKCSIDNLRSDLSFLDSAVPIAADEFLERRDRLAKALHATGIDAFVLEPGYTFQLVSLTPATELH